MRCVECKNSIVVYFVMTLVRLIYDSGIPSKS
jgi:hypothetical protein